MEVQLRRLGPHPKIKVLKKEQNCSSKVWVCGRGSNCQIYIKSKYASRRHFSITYKNCEYYITDLNSANGTFVNEEKVTEEQMLTFGNTISVGVPFEMFTSPDCFVYRFEPVGVPIDMHISDNLIESEKKLSEDEIRLIKEFKRESESIKKCISDVREQLRIREVSRKSELEDMLLNCLKAKNEVKVHLPSKEGTSGFKIHLFVERSEEDIAKTVTNENDVVIIEESKNRPRPVDDTEGSTPAKVQRVKNSEVTAEVTQTEELEMIVDEDQEVYEAETQIDESQPEPKSEKGDLLNYSQTEELIEIDDAEDADWVPSPKPEEARFDTEEDDDVVFLQTIMKPPKETGFPSNFQIGDDFTETDRKWLEKLLKVKEENEVPENSRTSQDNAEGTKEDVIDPGSDEKRPASENELEAESAAVTQGTLASMIDSTDVLKAAETLCAMSVESIPAPVEEDKEKKKSKKKVSFNLVPEVKYIERILKPKRPTDVERGRQQFVRVIHNFCNWNAHWLEECYRIPSDVYPPSVSEQPFRKVRNNYLNHSHYMLTFVPDMLLQIWEKIKEKRINGHNFFRQTVSFDSCKDYPTEKLTLYNCTGLVQSVAGHRNLLREGHLLVMRVHQAPLSTPEPNKYSKKVGYNIFGFVESKAYEKFTDQKVHPKLAERVATLPGEFYLVRLEILVKLRPNLQVDKEKLVQVQVVHQISPALRRFRGICYLPQSPLCNALLKLTAYHLPDTPPWKIVFKGPLSYIQEEIVLRLSQACFTLKELLYSIHGAAGTGKSHVVIALIWQLLFTEASEGKRPKIIYCGQDGPPLDDMVLRLMNSIPDNGPTFNMVRVSHLTSSKPEVNDLSLSVQSRKPAYKNSTDCEAEVLKRADVICTSCTSPMMSKMISVFGNKKAEYPDTKMVCIIDDAVSTRETDCVVPLLLGVTHLILVGDIYQTQPSYSSQTTWSLRVDIPLFLRIYDYFKNSVEEEERPFFTLRTQYRINASLSEFLNKHVYTSPFIVPEPSMGVGLRSYLLLVDKYEPTDKIHQKNYENFLVWKLVWEVFKLQGVFRYAVIACNEEQSQNLQRKITKSKFPAVEVNKVQAFHGREFDVVFFVYDGSNIHLSMIATAITRAKTSLFIVSLRKSLKVNSWFRMLTSDAEKKGYLKYIHPKMPSDEFKRVFIT